MTIIVAASYNPTHQPRTSLFPDGEYYKHVTLASAYSLQAEATQCRAVRWRLSDPSDRQASLPADKRLSLVFFGDTPESSDGIIDEFSATFLVHGSVEPKFASLAVFFVTPHVFGQPNIYEHRFPSSHTQTVRRSELHAGMLSCSLSRNLQRIITTCSFWKLHLRHESRAGTMCILATTCLLSSLGFVRGLSSAM